MKIFSIMLCITMAFGSIKTWKMINDEKGIQVYKKKIQGSKIVAFRGEGIIDANIKKVFDVLLDNNHRTEWVDRLKKSITLEKLGSNEYIVYQEFGLPWPLNNRDFVYKGKAYQDRQGRIVLELKSIDHPRSPKTVGVRAFLHHSAYVLTPLSRNQTKIKVEIHSNPKGMLPAWLVNLIQKKWPVKTLSAIKRQVLKPYVRERELPSVL